ncbi:MAG: type II secretion system F family protein [Anaerolineae bacterium]|jgi:hypothetical protein
MIFSPWVGLLFVSAALMILFADDIAYAVQRITRFRDSSIELRLSELPIVKWFVKRRRFRTDLTEIRDFMASLQLAASLGETLSGGLTAASEQFAHRGVFGERLKRQVESRLSISPEAVLEGLAEDFDSEELRDLLSRLEMAREAGASISETLKVSAEEVDSRIRDDIKQDIQRAPVTLTVPMAVGVFLPAIALSMYPLVSRLISNLARSP